MRATVSRLIACGVVVFAVACSPAGGADGPPAGKLTPDQRKALEAEWNLHNTTGMKAAVGPPICTREPPNAEIRKPATIAEYRPFSGAAPAHEVACHHAGPADDTPARA